MKRSILMGMLHTYIPVTSEEREFKNNMLTFIQKYPNCFERSLEIGHITASAWLLNRQGSHALLMHHRKLNKWLQLGGHCDGNPDVLHVAIKEAQEESGILAITSVSEGIFDIDIHIIPENSREKTHYHYDVRFLLQVTSNEQVIQNNESKELRWISKNSDALPVQTDSVIRMYYKWITKNSC